MKLYRAITTIICIFSVTAVALAQNHVGSGNALDLDGINDRVNLGAQFNNLSLPVTISAWVNPANSSLILPIFQSCADLSNWHGVFLTVDNGRLQASIGGGSNGFTINGRNTLYVPVTQFFGEWYHVAAVINGANNMKIFVNGIEMTGTYQGTATSMSNTNNGQAYIGFHQKNFQRHYEGQIDELSFWDVALTQAQIRDLMCEKIDTSNANLLAAWDFNGSTTSNTVADISGNGINGTKTGGIGHVLSGAPVGDVSDHHHQTANYNNASQNFSLQGQQISVSQMTSPASGVHVYRVNSNPTITNGISGCADSIYYGVFLAKKVLNQAPTFKVSLSGQTIAFDREKNDDPSWSTFSATANIDDRGEFITGIYAQFSFGNDTTLCAGDSILLSLPAGGVYSWSDGTNQQNNYLGAGDTVWGVATVSGCVLQDTIFALEQPSYIDLIADTTFCQAAQVAIQVPNGYTVIWDDNSTSPSRIIQQSGKYWGTFSNGACSFTDSFDVNLINIPAPNISDTAICEGDSVLVSLAPGYTYLWSDGQSNQNRYLNAGNSFWVKTSNADCERLDTITIGQVQLNNMQLLPADTVICSGERITVSLPTELSDVVWNDGSTARNRQLSSAGTWFVQAQTPCGLLADTLVLEVDDCEEKPLFVPNAFTPNGDGTNDNFLVKGFEGDSFNVKIFNRWGNLIFESTNPYFEWNGTFTGNQCSEGVYVFVISWKTRTGTLRSLHGTITLMR